ncbi:hypothetical protein HX089_14830 [Myroides odoratimimus]|uniref:DUF6266 family protein n=1 Tax=Myroides odoratimimus TaxID=76832 RepID=UPI002577634F|nr:DUF6266 family protein [Myroides odoratimimus]MDM1517650.1 hypothetical protein [Myroides odoratimimus]
MAESEKGILGPVRGKVGTVVGANWRGKNILRSVPRKSRKAPSAKQLVQRTKFKLVANFLSPLFALTSKYFGQYQGVKSRTNLAMSYHLLETIEESQGGEFEINYSKVVITKGVLDNVRVSNYEFENRNLTMEWTSGVSNNLSKGDDRVTAIVYNKVQKMFLPKQISASRDEATMTVVLAEEWKANEYEVWLVVTKGDQCSTSMYVGIV